jgi:hypothetical protein
MVSTMIRGVPHVLKPPRHLTLVRGYSMATERPFQRQTLKLRPVTPSVHGTRGWRLR